MLYPLKVAFERVKRAKEDSDVTLFFELLYLGEFILKLTTAGLVAGIEDDRDSHRYRLAHKLIRADGVGEWAQALNDVLGGPASTFLASDAKDDRRVITERLTKDSWQHIAVSDLLAAAQQFDIKNEISREKIALQSWFDIFPELRNKTRGHGAPKTSACAAAVTYLEKSVNSIANNNPIFQRDWAYLRQNLSGRYHVVPLGEAANSFNYLTKTKLQESGSIFREGLYIFYGRPRYMDLLSSDVDLTDFFIPNGAFSGSRYELHSPLTDSKKEGNASEFLAPAADRPTSETSGRGRLIPHGEIWANLPPAPNGYIARQALEEKVSSLLSNDRHPIVTLVGRGGIGKTSLALAVLHQLSRTDRFEAMVWFSARDIDLTQAGPKLAKPDVLTESDIAAQFCDLLEPTNRKTKGFKAISFMSENMAKSSLDRPILFIFDNFETVRNPIDVFNWIDTNIRLPNKALITTRFREFKADYPLDVPGMDRHEVGALIDNTAKRLGVVDIFTQTMRDEIFEQSDGHPYIVKIIVGEIADRGALGKPERIISGKDDILQALFERAYNNISASAKRVFLTICGWRSYIPQIAVEAMVFRNPHESFDPVAGIDELDRMSLIHKRKGDDGEEFLGVPLAAAIFGQKKLATSPLRTAIELDIRFLQELGPTSATAISQGARQRIRKLVQNLVSKTAAGEMRFEEVRAVLEFIAGRFPETWLSLAALSGETQLANRFELECAYLRRYIESDPAGPWVETAWGRLARLYRLSDDVLAACDAYTQAFTIKEYDYNEISSVANWLNNRLDKMSGYDLTDRAAVFIPLAKLMEARLSEASSTDLSRLAWLHLHAGNSKRSEEVARLGLSKDPYDAHCRRLIERLSKEW